jgi:hypothetical protein
MNNIILYKTSDGQIKIDTILKDETIWLTQAKMAELFDVKRPAVTKHLKNIFESGELLEQVKCLWGQPLILDKKCWARVQKEWGRSAINSYFILI